MATTRYAYDAAIAEERGDLLCIDGRRHDDETKIVARLHGLPREGQREIGVNAPLVKLVEHDRREVREQRILLQAGGQDALGGDQQPGVVPGTSARSGSAIPLARPSVQRPLVGDATGDDCARRHGAVGERSPGRHRAAPEALGWSCRSPARQRQRPNGERGVAAECSSNRGSIGSGSSTDRVRMEATRRASGVAGTIVRRAWRCRPGRLRPYHQGRSTRSGFFARYC